MNKETKIKIYLGTIYIFVLGIFLWFFFNNFSIQEITNYEFIRNYRDFLIKFKQSNFLLILIAYFIFTVVWVLLLGFGSPVAIVAGFIFGKWIGTIVVVSSLAIGATLLYIFANFFVRELIISKFEKKFAFINEKIKKNEFIYFFLYRFIGGIPFFIANILPVLFNIKLRNYFFGTFLGILPQIFIVVSLGSGFEKVIGENLIAPSFLDLLITKDIYIPLLSFFILILVIFFIKKKY
tara:strand:- start:131 stop:841 length:711 start_codon:yes stop_codon:yes gene_type:complete